jgi:Flp pilus assembly protein TadG
MLSRIKSLIEKRKGNEESGSAMIIFIMWMPIILGTFGLSVDMAIATYTSTTLQSALDTATQSSLSRAANPGLEGNTTVNPRLTAEKGHEYLVTYYNINRQDAKGTNKNPFLRCQGTVAEGGGKLVRPSTGCAWTENSYSVSTVGRVTEMNVRVVEKSTSIFIKIIGFETITYGLESSARVTYAIG